MGCLISRLENFTRRLDHVNKKDELSTFRSSLSASVAGDDGPHDRPEDHSVANDPLRSVSQSPHPAPVDSSCSVDAVNRVDLVGVELDVSRTTSNRERQSLISEDYPHLTGNDHSREQEPELQQMGNGLDPSLTKTTPRRHSSNNVSSLISLRGPIIKYFRTTISPMKATISTTSDRTPSKQTTTTTITMIETNNNLSQPLEANLRRSSESSVRIGGELNRDKSLSSIGFESASSRQSSCCDNMNDMTTSNSDIDRNEVLLFKDVEQLCSNIISEKLKSIENHYDYVARRADDHHRNRGKVMCLFVLGVPGSNEGEILFELVDHSSILSFIKGDDKSDNDNDNKINHIYDQNCPLYHFMDVGVLIEANIDRRIAQYRNIRKQTLKTTRFQIKRMTKPDSFSLDSNWEEGGTRPKPREGMVKVGNNNNVDSPDSLNSSILGITNQTTSCDSGNSESNNEMIGKNFLTDNASNWEIVEHYFGCLDTKHRSRLQLKLSSHHNSVTSHWVMRLIEYHVERLEQRFLAKFMEMTTTNDDDGGGGGGNDNHEHREATRKPIDRVYLIKIIPNQLNLFQQCLFLNQSPNLHNFRYPYRAIKFERRTNIRVFRREGKLKGHQGPGSSSSSGRRSPFNLVNISKLRLLNVSGRSRSDSNLRMGVKSCQKANDSTNATSQDHRSSSSNCPANEREAKMGPRFGDHFASYFKANRKLTSVRYHPDENQELAASSDKMDLVFRSNQSIGSDESIKSTTTENLDQVPPSSPGGVTEKQQANDGDDHHHGRAFLLLPKSHSSADRVRPASASAISVRHANQSQGANSLMFFPHLSIKTAVEIELLDFQHHVDQRMKGTASASGHKSSKSKCNHEHCSSSSTSFNDPIYYEYFRPPPKTNGKSIMSSLMESKSNSKSSNSANINSSGGGKTKNWARSYLLLPVRVAYANGQSQLSCELRCSQSKLIKLKSRSDLIRLIKFVDEAKDGLERDCKNWLLETIGINNNNKATNYHLQQAAAAHQSGGSSVLTVQHHHLFGKHRSSISNNHLAGLSALGPNNNKSPKNPPSQHPNNHHHQLQSPSAPSPPTPATTEYTNELPIPSLIVFKIDLDVTRLLRGNFRYPSSFLPTVEAILLQQSDNNNQHGTKLGSTTTTNNNNDDGNDNIGRDARPLRSALRIPKRIGGENLKKATTSTCGKNKNKNKYENENKHDNDQESGSEAEGRESQSDVKRSTSQLNMKRHVQFKLSDLPRRSDQRSAGDDNNSNGTIGLAFAKPPEHRLWIDESIFLAYRPSQQLDDCCTTLTNSQQHLLKLVSELYKHQVSITTNTINTRSPST